MVWQDLELKYILIADGSSRCIHASCLVVAIEVALDGIALLEGVLY
jgi:hypothetical protein